ncbi:MAG: GIY-YIG nuclease family protein, partial [candidate division WOR-3 bacterium]|nr:GIY-YIG nuclease family protein [candidate division WOR-3 bacterium]
MTKSIGSKKILDQSFIFYILFLTFYILMTGAYLLILYNPKKQRIEVGRLGKIDFAKGYYFYIGSGMKNLEQRVFRHKRKDKKIKWHIDYLTNKFKFIDAKLFPSSKRLEC